MHRRLRGGLFTACLACLAGCSASPELASWEDTETTRAITTFVERTTRQGSPDFVPESERLAVFDNDGTLWAEQPAYFQLLFAIDRVRALAPEHPEWRTQQPFRAVLENDLEALKASGKQGIAELLAATHAGMTTDEFAETVRGWLKTARHPTTGRPYTEMVYTPMLELLKYLRAHGYATYIVSGGGIDFVRVFSEEVYGVPPEQVVGSSLEVRWDETTNPPSLRRDAKLDFLDDKEGKPVAIHLHIGRHPVIAVGNSDGDFQMLQWTTDGGGPRLGVLIHHDDAAREWAYDRESHIGRLDRGLDEAAQRGWLVVSMAADWDQVFLGEPAAAR